FVLLASSGGYRTAPGRALDVLRARPLLLAPAVGVGLAALVLAPVLGQRLAQGGEGIRTDLWQSALNIYAQHPFLGGGPGTWVQLKIPANPPGTANLVLPHAHSLYFQAAAELGTIGLIALVILVIAVLH